MLAVDRDRADAWTRLGDLEARFGNVPAARNAYQRAISLQPTFIPASINLADLHRALGSDEEGEVVLRRLLALLSDNPDARHALGLLLARSDRRDEALVDQAEAAGDDEAATGWRAALAALEP